MIRVILAAGLLSAAFLAPALAQTTTTATPSAPQPTQPAAATGQEPPQEMMDALKALHCTVDKVTVCSKDGCQDSQSFGEIPLPAKMLADPERRILAGVNKDGLPHITPIQLYSQTDHDLAAQGTDGAVTWMLLADRQDDTMTFSAASDHTVLNGFGTCKDVDE
ncbi:hypothetical protein [Rhodoligotrophos defluvii]|uniref:hypothetical protein n=1 Tax=Rhodoligotrophos defluvii TaxID=2561934 RepID=UPI0010C9CDD7|nr:hypothetical protein [Rhodoligotrophos defluvii]